MFKDRRVLMEQEVFKQKAACGQLYLKIVKGEATIFEEAMYDSMKAKLADQIIDLAIIDQMIDEGHE